MIELKLNLPDWFLLTIAAYFVVRITFNILGIYFKRRLKAKANKKVFNKYGNNRRY